MAYNTAMAHTPQTYANHVRLDSAFHFFLLPVLFVNLIVAVVYLVRGPGFLTAWLALLSVAAIVAVLKIRLYPLKAQDRIIRLEEQLRFARVLPEPLRGRCGELTEAQLVALRFAPDIELPALVEQVLAGGMKGRDIKKEIRTWRPDYFRI